MQYDDTKMKDGSLCTGQCWVSVLEAKTSVQSEDTKIKNKNKNVMCTDQCWFAALEAETSVQYEVTKMKDGSLCTDQCWVDERR